MSFIPNSIHDECPTAFTVISWQLTGPTTFKMCECKNPTIQDVVDLVFKHCYFIQQDSEVKMIENYEHATQLKTLLDSKRVITLHFVEKMKNLHPALLGPNREFFAIHPDQADAAPFVGANRDDSIPR